MCTKAWLGFVHVARGRLEEALTAVEQEPYEQLRLLGLTLVYQAKGRKGESDAALRELIEKYSADSGQLIARAYAYRGEVDTAFEWLERAYVQRDPDLAFVKLSPELRNLRTDPRWQSFVEKMGLAD